MGVPSGGGTQLGQATGSIVINVQQLAQAQAAVQSAARQMTQAFNAVNATTGQAQGNITGLSSGLRQLAGAFGLTVGAAGVAQLAKAINANEELATAYRRQSVAARELAGSQERLNELLNVYDQATGSVIGKAQALSDVTRLLSVGFADSSQELDQFVRAVRGISLATGRPQEFVVTQLQLELLNQTGFRLDQIGLGMEEVRKRAEELAAANKNLTSEQAYQQAVLQTANEKFGALTKSAVAQATEVELLKKAWTDLRLEIGQGSSTAVNAFAKTAKAQLQEVRDVVRGLIFDLQSLGQIRANIDAAAKGPADDALRNFLTADPLGDFADDLDQMLSDWLAHMAGRMTQSQSAFVSASVSRDRGRHPKSAPPAGQTAQGFNEEQRQVIRDHYDAVAELESSAARDRQEATRQYEEQRTSTIRQYELTIAREAEDFARERLRAEQDFQLGVERMQRDTERREQRAGEDLARDLARARDDSAERTADLRKDANKRLLEIDEDFAKQQERRQRDFKDDQLSAAGRLDAIALLELRKGRARQLQDAKEAHEEQKADLREQLDERIAGEKEALAKRTQQAQEASERQLKDAREADAQRLEDMQADFELRKTREDEDRETRLRRMGEDFQLQLEELARQQELRLAQIGEQQARERLELEEQFQIALNEAKVRNEAWMSEDKRRTDAAVADYLRVGGVIASAAAAAAMMLGGGGVSFPSLANPNRNLVRPIPAPTGTGTIGRSAIGSVLVAPGAVVVYGAIGQNEEEIGHIVVEKMADVLEQIAGGR